MPDLLTTRQVQDLLKLDRTTVYRLVDGGQLPAIRVGKQWRFERSALNRWLDGQSAPGNVVEAAHDRQATPGATAESGLPLAELLPLQTAQMLQDAFAELLGATIVITEMDGRPLTRVSNPCGLYSAMLRDPDAVARCINDWHRLAGAVPLEPRFSPNDLGLLCARGLIRKGNELKGMVFVGGIAPDNWPPTAEQIGAMAAAFAVAPGYVEAYVDETHHLDRQQRQRVLSSIQAIADIISQLIEECSVSTARVQSNASLLAAVQR